MADGSWLMAKWLMAKWLMAKWLMADGVVPAMSHQP
jgi:hypothetical protein